MMVASAAAAIIVLGGISFVQTSSAPLEVVNRRCALASILMLQTRERQCRVC